VKKADIKSVKNKIDQAKIAAQKRSLSYQDPKFHTLQNTNKKQKLENDSLTTSTTTLQIDSNVTLKQDAIESKPILQIISQQRNKQAQVIAEEDDVICEDKPVFDPKKYCVYCQKAVTNMTNHSKGTKHQENVYNSQIIYEKEGVQISRKNFKALQTKEQWLSDSVSFSFNN